MKVIDFEITVFHHGKKVKASCQKFKVLHVPQIRVCFGMLSEEKVYTLYEVNQPKKKYYWFQLPKKRDNDEVKSIAKHLVKSLKAKQPLD